MRTTIKGILGIAALLLAAPGMAAVITITPMDCDLEGADRNCWIDSNGNDQPSLSDLATLLGLDAADLSILYKSEQGGSDGGLFADDYDTAYDNEPNDPSEATITWLGGDSITCPECFLWVKDGNQDPSLYVFDIGTWNGMDDIFLDGFWPSQGAISNIGIFGGGGGEQLPEPATLGLLGIAAMGLGLMRRRRTV